MRKNDNFKLESRQITDLKSFLQIFQPFGKQQNGSDALKFLYQHTCFQYLNAGEMLHHISGTYNGSIIIVVQGLLNGFLDNDQHIAQQNIWIGVPNSVFLVKGNLPANNDEKMSIEALSPSLLIIIPFQFIEKSCEKHPALNAIFNQFLYPKAIKSLNDFTLLQKITDPGTRYNYFSKLFPCLYNILPVHLRYAYTGTVAKP